MAGLVINEYIKISDMCQYLERNGWTVMTFARFLKRFGYMIREDITKSLGIGPATYQHHIAWKDEKDLREIESLVSIIVNHLKESGVLSQRMQSSLKYPEDGITMWYINWRNYLTERGNYYEDKNKDSRLCNFMVREIFMKEVKKQLRTIVYGKER